MPGTSVFRSKGFEKRFFPDGLIAHRLSATYTGFFKNARRLMFWKPVLVDNSGETIINNNVNIMTETNDSIRLLVAHTIKGAAHDSSERDPPPSCHPGTRLEFCESIGSWMHNSHRPRKVLWLRGSAGVGKSAIMQTVAQVEDDSPDSTLGAAIFFSRPNERDDPKRLFTTIAYQLAIRYTCYRQYITEILAHDPQIVVKSISVQFKWFILKPFVERDLFRGLSKAVSIFLDGMNECKGEEVQRELILLIGRFSLQYPDVPLIWVIASRPEPHIHSAFSEPQIKDACWKIIVPVDSDQAYADVERFLRDKFNEIRKRYLSFFPQGNQAWPSEVDFLKIATAASGHFLFVTLVVRFIIDENYGNPVSQLQTVLAVIDSTSSLAIQSNPFSLLDNLYTQILSSIPLDVLPKTKMLLAWSFFYPWKGQFPGASEMLMICNWLDLDQAAAYGALRKLHSVIQIPPLNKARHNTYLKVFHTSFTDYLGSSSRSGEYYTTLTFEEAMARIVQKLLESHNLATSIIEPSRTHLSWIHGEYGRSKFQDQFWRTSLGLTISFIDKISSMENSPEYLDQLVIFLEDIDYGTNSIQSPDWPFAFALPLSLSPVQVLTTLENWGLAQTIGLESISLDSVRPGTVLGNHFIRPSDTPSFLGDGYIELRITGADWRDCVRRHLNEIAQFQSSVRATLLGKASKSAIWIADLDGNWYYTFPYNQT